MKILCYQGTPYSGDVDVNLNTIETTAKAASLLNVDVLVFPECFITGYNIGRQVLELAQELSGNAIKALQKIAMESAVSIVTGFPEREGEQVFNSAIAINSKGKIVGHHRKVFLFGGEEKEVFSAGENFNVFELNGYQCGLSICYDIEFPESTRDLAKQGAQLIFNPTANMQPYIEVPKTLARARALENNVTVVYANLCGEENGLHYTGQSAVISPNGIDLARAGDRDALLIADISDCLNDNAENTMSTQLIDLKNSKYRIDTNHSK